MCMQDELHRHVPFHAASTYRAASLQPCEANPTPSTATALLFGYSWKSPSAGAGPGGADARSSIAAVMRETVAASVTSGGMV